MIESAAPEVYTASMKRFVWATVGLVGGLLLSLATASAFTETTHPPIAVPVWVHESIAPGGLENDVELDSNGQPHVLFVDSTNHILRYAHREGGAWVVADLRPFPNDTPPADLAYDLALNPLDDTPYVAYVDTGEEALYFGSPQSGAWQWDHIGPGGRLLSLRADGPGGIHMALVVGRIIAYYSLAGGQWAMEQVGPEDDYVWNLSLALDADGRPHLAGTGANGSFHAQRQGQDDWLVEALTLKNVEGLVIGSGGEPAYLITEAEEVFDRPPFSLVTLSLAQEQAGGRQVVPLWQDYDWYVTSEMAIDAGGAIHIAFYDVAGRPHYMVLDGMAVIRHESPFSSGAGVLGLALGGDGRPCVSHGTGANLLLSCREIRLFPEYAFVPDIHR